MEQCQDHAVMADMVCAAGLNYEGASWRKGWGSIIIDNQQWMVSTSKTSKLRKAPKTFLTRLRSSTAPWCILGWRTKKWPSNWVDVFANVSQAPGSSWGRSGLVGETGPVLEEIWRPLQLEPFLSVFWITGGLTTCKTEVTQISLSWS